MSGLGLSGGYAAGEGADMLQKVIQAAAIRADLQKRQQLLEQELRQRAESDAADRAMREKLYQGQQEDRAQAMADRKSAAEAMAASRERDDLRAELGTMAGGTTLSDEEAAPFRKIAPGRFEDASENPPDLVPGTENPLRPSGRIRLRKSPAEIEAERKSREAESSQTRGFENAKEVARIQASNRPAEPLVAVIGPDGQPVLVPRGQAVGKRPASGAGSGGGLSDTQTAYGDERTARVREAVSTLKEKVGPWVTGPGSLLSYIPGTDARDFEAELNTLKGNIAFNELTEMRAASKTGGALGSVSNKEITLLESSLAGLDTGQSPANFARQLDRITESLDRWERAKSGVASPKPPAAPSTGPKVGTRRTINGQLAEWDGQGWLPVR